MLYWNERIFSESKAESRLEIMKFMTGDKKNWAQRIRLSLLTIAD